ncbi:cyclic nucleotide-binding-like protein [Zopfochytrium polystomum]|nr:cyclic nucleotide-binding-like protein [Zopfochytrium polystomum]
MRREPRDHSDLKPLSGSRSNSECLNQMFPVVDPMFLQANSSGKQHVKSGPLSLLSFRSTSSRSWIAGVSKGSSNQRTSVGETRLSGKSVGNVEYKESPKQRLGSSISLVQAAETKSLNNSNLFTTRIGEVSRETTVTDDLRSVPFARNSTADHKKMDKPEKRALQWDALAFVIQSSMLFVIPGVVAFPTSLWTQNAVSLSYSFYFALDALSRVWTAGVRRTSALPVPSQRIRWTSKALQTRDRLWLCVDLVSSIPFAPIASALNVSPRLSSVLNCTYFAHFRRFASVKRFATRLIVFNHLSTSARAMAKMFATIFVYLHLSACYMVWTERMRGEAAGESVVGPKIGISGANWRDGYTLGIWGAVANCFAATSSFRPSTLQSYWLTIILVCLGACLSATFHGTVAAYSSGEGGDLAAAYGRKLDEIEEYMRHHSVPEMLRTLIGQSIGARYQGRAFNEEKILAGLNPSLRQEVLLSNCRTLLESIYFFRLPAGDERQSWVLRQLSLGLRCAVFSEGETVYLEGMPGSEMFLVVEGVASMWLGSRRLGFVDAGSWFGEFNLLTPGPRIDTVRAATKLSCLVLDRVTVQKIVDDVPEIAAKLTDLKQKCIETLHEICA